MMMRSRDTTTRKGRAMIHRPAAHHALFVPTVTCRPSRQKEIETVESDHGTTEHHERPGVVTDHGTHDEGSATASSGERSSATPTISSGPAPDAARR